MTDIFKFHEEPRAEPPTATVIIRPDGGVNENVLSQWETFFLDTVRSDDKKAMIRRIMAAARLGFAQKETEMATIQAQLARLLRQMADQVEQK